ncbi:hypothetical protein F0562_030684 [Nyssa sinensis]|uniref:glucose-6-phosphate 1-epimerase n=1 Tax=Nyssa sinensis TaxID=561372 RepID=A0A5J5B3D8_9ASTE|nr:hypothetical protein F0562_030684 [Nyssa sinensis]
MSSERVPVEVCRGANGLEKVVLREVRGSSAEDGTSGDWQTTFQKLCNVTSTPLLGDVQSFEKVDTISEWPTSSLNLWKVQHWVDTKWGIVVGVRVLDGEAVLLDQWDAATDQERGPEELWAFVMNPKPKDLVLDGKAVLLDRWDTIGCCHQLGRGPEGIMAQVSIDSGLKMQGMGISQGQEGGRGPGGEHGVRSEFQESDLSSRIPMSTLLEQEILPRRWANEDCNLNVELMLSEGTDGPKTLIPSTGSLSPVETSLSLAEIEKTPDEKASNDGTTLPLQVYSRRKKSEPELVQAQEAEPITGSSPMNNVVGLNVRLHSFMCQVVYLYGGHVTSWKNEHGEELLFVSSKAIFKPPKAIRGGIPICFPQFSSHGSLEQHGFARNRFWTVDPDPPPFPTNSASKAFVDLILKPSEEDLKIWPYSFEFRLRIALGPGGDLMLTSRIRNTSTEGKPFTFTFAYHTYFSVSDISEVRVEGLETLDYLDNLQNKERFTEQGDAITFESEVDKIYLSTPTKIAILDHEKKRTFVIRKDGLPDAVVWNPWDKKAKAMADFGDDEYKHMLCVEAAAVEKPITLKPEQLKNPLYCSIFCTGALLQCG